MRFRIVTIQETRLRSCAVGHEGVHYPCNNALSSNSMHAVICVSVQVRLLGFVNTFTLTIVVLPDVCNLGKRTAVGPSHA